MRGAGGGPFWVPIDYDEGIPHATWPVAFQELARDFRTGDLVLQHGTQSVSQAISVLQGSFWSHVGMIVRPEDLAIQDCDIPWLTLESNTLTDLPDWISGGAKPRGGPMAVDLEARLRANLAAERDVGMAWRSMRLDWSEEMLSALRAYVNQVKDKEFTDDPDCAMKMLASWMTGRVQNLPNLTQYMFCSELVAGCFRAVGLLPERWVPNAYTPKDFSRNGRIPLLRSASLGPEVLIDPDSLRPRG